MNRRNRAIVHLSLGLGMLAVVVAAGLSPNAGIVQASSNCTYGSCPSSSPFPLWGIASAIAAVLVALLLAFLLIRRRRRPGQPPSEWQGPGTAGGTPPAAVGGGGAPYEGAAMAGGVAAASGAGSGPEPLWQEGAPDTASPSATPATSGEYLEGPETVAPRLLPLHPRRPWSRR